MGAMKSGSWWFREPAGQRRPVLYEPLGGSMKEEKILVDTSPGLQMATERARRNPQKRKLALTWLLRDIPFPGPKVYAKRWVIP